MSKPVPWDPTAAPANFVSVPEEIAEPIAVAGERDQRLALYRLRASRRDGPVLLIGHACGFAAGAYVPLMERLGDAAEVFAFDARGHGASQSSPHDLSLYGANDYGRDLVHVARAVREHTGGRPLYFAGHSLAGATMARLACYLPADHAKVAWRAVMLFEPPIHPSDDRPEFRVAVAQDTVTRARTLRRRRDWASREALVDGIRGRGLFAHVTPDSLAAYARGVLRPAEGGGFTLACAPEIEEATFAAFANGSIYSALADFPRDLPVHIVAGDAHAGGHVGWPTAFAAAIAARLECGRVPGRTFTQLKDRGHLMIQEDPQAAADLIRGMLATY